MMNAFLYWLLPGMIGTVYLFWFFSLTDPIKQITISDVFAGIFIMVIGIVASWVSVIMCIGMTWEKFDVGDIVLWKKMKKEPRIDKVSDADILEDLLKRAVEKPSLKQQLIEKLNFEQKPIKGLEEIK